MEEIKDPILKEKGTPTDNQEPFTNGLYITGLTKEQIEIFGSFLNDLYTKKRKKHKSYRVTRNASTMLQGAIFALGTKTLNNIEWKEHCASSLREIFHEWNNFNNFESDFSVFFRDKNNKLTSEEKDVFRNLKLLYQYFSGIDHHDASGIMGALIALLKDNSLKLEDCYKDEVFIEEVKKFFSNISKIIEFSKKKLK